MKGNSNCCDAVLINGRCADCGYFASALLYDCETCRDTGLVDYDSRDKDGHWEEGAETKICPDCSLKNI